ncbi:group II intron reverse transcriptase/maturase [Roseofilum sp. Belize Diploria]|uniref:group II intron reverse transcriptase/maturase n=1 Tax=Roseofilum sp. Belize Diploria TaxID=2821501 RepID=UPI001B2E72D8|nr:group II intron reverse transcriptase/maturase [Roseofilum sp. Belize Diploria]MBP0011431.1 group II intron reverse transcriptase/maturase [Roseofilum sp. Belize Diploria]
MNANSELTTTNNGWNSIPWKKVQRKVFKVQKSIYKAVKSGQNAKARKLQKILSKSYYARLLAVRRVSQDNQGKKTAGIDGIKSISPQQRLDLVDQLRDTYRAKPLRRVWIPKPGREEKRPLGIPNIKDRAMQTVVKLALEPYWEAKFESESYGFRPGRSAHDAIAKIFAIVNQYERYVLDADIAKCFEKIDHKKLLSKMDCPHSLKRHIKSWLKVGVLDRGIFEATTTGTPQGGVISPLLANIALDGMIRDIVERFPNTLRRNGKNITNYKPIIVRYADDFVVFHRELEVVQQCKIAISDWLSQIGLELKPGKTRICHTLKIINVDGKQENPGFDFLGFNIRQYPVGKNKSVKTPQGKITGFKTLIKPSQKAIKAHRETVKSIIKRDKSAPQSGLIAHLNPVIRGWCNYFRGVVSKETFSMEDHIMWLRLRAWTISRTGKANYQKLNKYFSQGKNGAWTFQSTKEGYRLLTHSETPIKRHILVRPDKSPHDGDWVYWSKRRGQHIGTPTRIAKLLHKQKGKCNHCGLYFTDTDLVEVDHIIPKSLGGKDEYKNLQLLHKHCHDQKTTNDGSLNRTNENG